MPSVCFFDSVVNNNIITVTITIANTTTVTVEIIFVIDTVITCFRSLIVVSVAVIVVV